MVLAISEVVGQHKLQTQNKLWLHLYNMQLLC